MKLASGKYKQAIDYYNAALQRNPNLADVYLKRGDAKEELNDVKGAIEDYGNAIRLIPECDIIPFLIENITLKKEPDRSRAIHCASYI